MEPVRPMTTIESVSPRDCGLSPAPVPAQRGG